MIKEHAIEKIHQLLIDHMGSIENLSILDYGCGTGGLTKLLLHQEKNPSCVYAIDNNLHMIEKVTASFASEISLGRLNTCLISDPKQLTPDSFDVIFCHNVLELVEQKEQFIVDLFTLLKENGVLIVSHMDFDSIVYNSSFKELTRRLVHHFADTKQAWMAASDGQIGRKIPGIIERAHIHNYSFETWRWTERTFQEKDYGYIMANMLLEVASDSFMSDDLQAWKHDLKHKAETHDYFFAIDIDVATIKNNKSI